ncbi:MAG: hypothetical protein WCL30_03790 [Pseudomonadota bacterium]
MQVKPKPSPGRAVLITGNGGILSGIGGAINNASNALFGFSFLGMGLGWVGSKVGESTKAGSALSTISNNAAALNVNISELGDDTLVAKAGSKLSNYIGKTMPKYAGKLQNNNMSMLMMAGANMAVGTANLASSFGERLDILKQMQADLNGGEVPSTFAIIFGSKSLHPAVLEARKEAMSLSTFTGTLINLAGIFGNAYLLLTSNSQTPSTDTGIKGFMKNNLGFIAKQMAVTTGTSMAANALTSKHTCLQAYKAACLAEQDGYNLSGEIYMGIISGLAPDKTPPARVQMIAAQCMNSGLSSQETLRYAAAELFPRQSVGRFTANALSKSRVSSYGQPAYGH